MVRRRTLEATGNREGRRGAGGERARPWSSAAAMSAQCCAGQVSGARRRAGATTHRATGPRGFPGCAPRLAAERGAAGGLLRADPEPPGLEPPA